MPYAALFKCFEPSLTSLPKKNKDNTTTIHYMLPSGKWYLNGLCKTYNSDYPNCLKSIITKDEYQYITSRLNDCGYTYFPCNYVLIIAYLFCLLTCFLSLLLPMCCAVDMVEVIDDEVKALNDRFFKPRELRLVFVRKWFRTSWVCF